MQSPPAAQDSCDGEWHGLCFGVGGELERQRLGLPPLSAAHN
jgi:hypothetical protein